MSPPDPGPGAFALPEGARYLDCAYMSPLPRAVEEAGRRALRRQRFPADYEPADFFEPADRIRRAFCRLVGADDPSRVALVPAVSYGAALVARNLELDGGESVVLAGDQFPSNVYPWTRLAREAGAEVRFVERPDGGGDEGISARWTGRIVETIDRDTGLVALPQAHWTDGTLLDLSAVGDRAREVDAVFVVDGTQTVGAHPFRVGEVRPDAVLCAGYKWLLGPYGLGVAWLGDRFVDAEPLEETWLGRRGSEDFAGLVDYREAYRPGADRLDMGERSQFLLAPMLAEAMELLAGWGVEAVADQCRALTGRAAAGVREAGWRVEPADGRCANIVGLGAPSGRDPAAVRRRLREADIHVSVRGDSVRVSPHVYNEAEDVDVLLEALTGD